MIRLVVRQGNEGEACKGLGFFQDGELLGEAVLQQVIQNQVTGNYEYTDIPILLVQKEEKEQTTQETA